jgi:hypothetical protein
MPTSKRRGRTRTRDARFPVLTIHVVDGPYDKINGKWVKVDKVVTPNLICVRVPAKKLRSKTRVGATR